MPRILIAAVAVFLAATALAQDEEVTIETTEVVPGLYMLSGANGAFVGGNMAVLTGNDRALLIDDGMEPIASLIIEAAEAAAGRPIDSVVNTHVHGDHVGSNAELAGTGSLIYAHDNIRKRLIESPEDAGGEAGLPMVTFSDTLTFHDTGHEARVFHVAHAHTDGDAVIHFPELNVIHTGDAMFNYLFPYIDLDNGGSVKGYLAAQRRIAEIANDETIIIPGHGPLAGKADIEAAIAMLADAEQRVAALVAEGKSADEIVAINPLADYHDTWNWGFISTERMTRTLVRSLAQ